MYKIMLVDDETSSQDILRKYIETRHPDCQVCSMCGNGQDALETFSITPADIVLVDISMPLMNGLTLIEKLNELTEDYVPIIISGYGEFEYAKTAMRLGVVHYLLKPVDFQELTHSLEAAQHTLFFNRLARNALTWQDDDSESFFMDILQGNYADRAAAQKHFDELSLPFSYGEHPVTRIKIVFTQTDQWIYGRDAMYTAIGNMINMTYQPLFQLSLFHDKDSCEYLFIPDSYTPDSFDALCDNINNLLHITIEICSVSTFSSIEQLRSRCDTVSYSGDSDLQLQGSENANIQVAIENAIRYMKEHCSEDLTRDDIAKKVYMSGAHFSRCFKLVTETTYKDYLTKIRMQKAIELLKTDMRIQDISLQVGYPNPNRFNINFRNYTTYTPSEYRSYVLKMM